ncbi:ankyrin repeat domain-containing protein [Palleronia caenipelagi]|uniref:Ankyrin repeat domain-containing protein n=1 Tax=Palleronia caenipelagi TaxID=2489174 RepID=A0A547PW32_9RHOB|nr:ankyrin repeat domain-containing protein [Palleronia caenipelagi]TRD18360.1 ankyrin repeat domain-containing protein [Palleronia caenipelagi]
MSAAIGLLQAGVGLCALMLGDALGGGKDVAIGAGTAIILGRNASKRLKLDLAQLETHLAFSEAERERMTALLSDATYLLKPPSDGTLRAALTSAERNDDVYRAIAVQIVGALPLDRGEDALEAKLKSLFEAATKALLNQPEYQGLRNNIFQIEVLQTFRQHQADALDVKRSLQTLLEELNRERNQRGPNVVPLIRRFQDVAASPAALNRLNFEAQGTSFVGRESATQSLRDFIETDKPLSWWQVSGDGGQGKSRLALEFLEQVPPEWHAGFLQRRDLSQLNWNTVEFKEPTLFVIDYVAAPDKAKQFVEMMASLQRRIKQGNPSIDHPVRVLILERTPFKFDTNHGISATSWLRASGASSADTATLDVTVFKKENPLQLDPLCDTTLVSIAQEWRTARGRDRLDEVGCRALLSFLHRGEDRKSTRPLFAMIFAETYKPSDGALTLDDILGRLLNDEQSHMAEAPGKGARNLALLANMIGGVDVSRDLVRSLKERHAGETALLEFYELQNFPDNTRDAAARLCGYGGADGDRIEARSPDIVAEFQVCAELSSELGTVRPDQLTTDAATLDVMSYLGFLGRLADDFPRHTGAAKLFCGTVPAPLSTLLGASSGSGLIVASEIGYVSGVQLLLSQGINADDCHEKSGTFPLLLAAQNGHAAVVDALLAAGAEVNRANEQSGTFPLLMAAQNGHAAVVDALLAAGAEVNRANEQNGLFPLLMAAQEGHAGVVDALLAAGAKVNQIDEQDGPFPLLMAAENGHAAVVDALLAAGAEVNRANEQNGTFPLLMAAQEGHAAVVDALLATGAEVNRAIEQNSPFPLLMAAENGHAAVVDALLAAGAEVNRANEQNGTFPLLMAAQEGHAAVVDALLAAGAEVNRANEQNGPFPLLMAAHNGHAAVVDALLAAGAEVNQIDEQNGLFPLLQAAQEGHAAVVDALLAAGAEVNRANEQNGTLPLILAAQQGHAAVVDALLAAGAEVNRANEQNGTLPLLQAAQEGHAAVVDALLAAGVEVNRANEQRGTFPLLLAALQGHAAVVDALLAAGADIEKANTKNASWPLLVAAANGQTDVVSVLLRAGADPLRRHSGLGATAAEVALSQGFNELASLLKEAKGHAGC